MMKFRTILQFSVLLVVLTGTMTWLTSCKNDDDGVDPRTQQINDLTATWQMSAVTNDNNDVTDQFTGFTLTVDGLNYRTQNGGNPWPASGTYDFKGDDLNILIRNDGAEITIDELTATSLVLSFNFSSVTGGRTSGVTGDFTFSLTKQ